MHSMIKIEIKVEVKESNKNPFCVEGAHEQKRKTN